ncbi:hypothetical protein JMUB7545_27600 [Staphylococcus aureus]
MSASLVGSEMCIRDSDYLGVDISKRSSVVAHYKNGKFQKEFFIQNNKNGYNYLLL